MSTHHVATVEPLDLTPVSSSLDPVAVLVPDQLPLGLFDLLVDDLLGGLGRDSRQRCVELPLGGLEDLSELGIRLDLSRVLQGDLDLRIGEIILFDDRVLGEHLEDTALLVEVGTEVLLAAVILARRRRVGFFDGLNDRLGFETFFASDQFDRLVKIAAHGPIILSANRPKL